MKALVVDRSRLYQAMLSNVLEKAGADIQATDSIETALDSAAKNHFDIICVSGQFSDGNGLDFCQRLREMTLGHHTSVFLFTANKKLLEGTSWIEAGISECFAKDDFDNLSEQIALVSKRANRNDVSGAKVLYVEDSKPDAMYVIAHFEEIGIEVSHFTTAEQALEVLRSEYDSFNLVVTDMILEGTMTGLSLLRTIRAHEQRMAVIDPIPVMAITGFDDKSRRIDLFHDGLDDFISKPIVVEELIARTRNLITRNIAFAKVREQSQKLECLAITDPLTECLNRRGMYELAEKSIHQHERREADWSILLIDLDHFKSINDTYGHDCGDEVLVKVGQVLRDCCREGDIVARFGGEEFIIFLADCDGNNAEKRAEEIRQAISRISESEPVVSASIGVSCNSDTVRPSLNTLIKIADEGVYAAKDAGRNCVVRLQVTTPMLANA